MDTISVYIEYIGLPLLIGAPLAGIAAFFMIPGRIRLFVCLAGMMMALTLGQLVGLGALFAISKVLSGPSYVAVALAALMHRGPKRRVAGMAWMYVAAGILSYLYIWTVIDLPMAVVIRTQWLAMCAAAFCVSRTIVDEASLRYVVAGLAVGLVGGLVPAGLDLVLHPSFIGTGRWTPWDANPNHVGALFAMATPFALFCAFKWRAFIPRMAMMGGAAVGCGMGLLTASRSTFVVMVGSCAPMFASYARKPLVLMLGAFIVVGGLAFTMSFSEAGFNAERMTEVVPEGRLEQNEYYLEIISQRPIFGLLGTQGESFARVESEDTAHAHNAYLTVLFFGGITYGIPVFMIVAYTALCVTRVWLARDRVRCDRTLLLLLCAVMTMTYAHGFVNTSLYYPTTVLAFLHVLLSVLFINWASDLTKGHAELLVPPAAADADDGAGEQGWDQWPQDATDEAWEPELQRA